LASVAVIEGNIGVIFLFAWNFLLDSFLSIVKYSPVTYFIFRVTEKLAFLLSLLRFLFALFPFIASVVLAMSLSVG